MEENLLQFHQDKADALVIGLISLNESNFFECSFYPFPV